MDPSHKHADPAGGHRDDAACDGRELHQLDRRGILVRVRGLQVPKLNFGGHVLINK